MNELIILILSIIPHEIGHYLAYRAMKVKPKISLTWWGISIEGGYNTLKPLGLYLIAIAGILWGAAFLQAFNVSITTWLIYIIMCFVDIMLIINLLSVKRELTQSTIREIQLDQAWDIILKEGDE